MSRPAGSAARRSAASTTIAARSRYRRASSGELPQVEHGERRDREPSQALADLTSDVCHVGCPHAPGLNHAARDQCDADDAVSYTHLRAHETDSYLVCRLLLEKKKKKRT